MPVLDEALVTHGPVQPTMVSLSNCRARPLDVSGQAPRPDQLLVLPRLASRVTLAVRADARDVMYLSFYQLLVTGRKACSAVRAHSAALTPGRSVAC